MSNNNNNNNNKSNNNINVLSISDINAEFLPLIYDIVRSIERETHESVTQKSLNIREQHSDCNTKIQQLKDRFNELRTQLTQIAGIDVTKEEQLKSLEALRQQLIMKKDLLMKYKNSCPFDPKNINN